MRGIERTLEGIDTMSRQRAQHDAISMEVDTRPEREEQRAQLLTICLGGMGGNFGIKLHELQPTMLDIKGYNTDKQDLAKLPFARELIGRLTTGGGGAGGNPNTGREAMLESQEEFRAYVRSLLHRPHDPVRIIYIAAGLGGGTGSGAAPLCAQIAREEGAIVIMLLVIPNYLLGDYMINVAKEALEKIQEHAHLAIIVDNYNIYKMENGHDLTVPLAYEKINELLAQSVAACVNLITENTLENVDLNDFITLIDPDFLKERHRISAPSLEDEALEPKAEHPIPGGLEAPGAPRKPQSCKFAIIGLGQGSGEHRVEQAFTNAINSPLLVHNSIASSRNVLVQHLASRESPLKISEQNEIFRLIRKATQNPLTDIKVGGGESQHFSDDMLQLMIIALNFEERKTPLEIINEIYRQHLENDPERLGHSDRKPQETTQTHGEDQGQEMLLRAEAKGSPSPKRSRAQSARGGIQGLPASMHIPEVRTVEEPLRTAAAERPAEAGTVAGNELFRPSPKPEPKPGERRKRSLDFILSESDPKDEVTSA